MCFPHRVWPGTPLLPLLTLALLLSLVVIDCGEKRDCSNDCTEKCGENPGITSSRYSEWFACYNECIDDCTHGRDYQSILAPVRAVDTIPDSIVLFP